jgi:hypothetical protein
MELLILITLIIICRLLYCINQNLRASNNLKWIYYRGGKYYNEEFEDFEYNKDIK